MSSASGGLCPPEADEGDFVPLTRGFAPGHHWDLRYKPSLHNLASP